METYVEVFVHFWASVGLITAPVLLWYYIIYKKDARNSLLEREIYKELYEHKEEELKTLREENQRTMGQLLELLKS